MEYADLVAVYRRLEATRSNNEKTAVLAETFAGADAEHLPLLLTLVRGEVFAPTEDADLGVSSSLTRRAVLKATGVDADELDRRWRETGDLGSAAEWAVENATQRTLFGATLTVRDVHDTLRELADYAGEGSEDRRVDAVAGLVADADPVEARYVVRTALGHLRVGVGEGTVRDAVAAAFLVGPEEAIGRTGEDSEGGVELHLPGEAVAAVERAHQVTNDFRVVAETARDRGRAGLAELDVEPFRPVGVMLARKADRLREGLVEVLDREGTPDPADLDAVPEGVLVERKYDGVRVQLHRDGGEVRVFTRRLEDVTDQFPDVVAAVRSSVTADPCVLDGELRGYDPETRDPVPFQEFSRRVKRKYDVAELAEEVPAVVHLFDALSVDGETLLEAPLRERLDRLEGAFEPEPWAIERAEHLVPGPGEGVGAVEEFYAAALSAGHEGVMLKNLGAPYEPGRRVGRMLKVKPVMEPLELVVTRARYSEGRRSGNLGRLYLACRADGPDDAGGQRTVGVDGDGDDDADDVGVTDAGGAPPEGEAPASEGFLEVGRLSTGYTDEELADLTDRLEELVVAREGREVRLRPEVVVEVAYEEIQASPEYGSGYALRFPRFEGVREDLSPADADGYRRVRDLYERQ